MHCTLRDDESQDDGGWVEKIFRVLNEDRRDFEKIIPTSNIYTLTLHYSTTSPSPSRVVNYRDRALSLSLFEELLVIVVQDLLVRLGSTFEASFSDISPRMHPAACTRTGGFAIPVLPFVYRLKDVID